VYKNGGGGEKERKNLQNVPDTDEWRAVVDKVMNLQFSVP
jgi:hypothetical protein